MRKRILIIGELNKETEKVILKLQSEGHEVIVASKKQTLQAAIHMPLDLTSIESIKSFIDKFNIRYAYLDVVLFQESTKSADYTLTADGYDPMIMIHFLSTVLLTEGLKVSLKTEEHARIIYLTSEAGFKGVVSDPMQLFTAQRSFMNAKRMLLMYAVYISNKLKDDHVTVNLINEPVDDPGIIQKLFGSKTSSDFDEDLYYLMMSDDLRYKTSKLFSGQQIMVIPQDKIRRDEIHLLASKTKKILRLK